jgi:hypothetical protein
MTKAIQPKGGTRLAGCRVYNAPFDARPRSSLPAVDLDALSPQTASKRITIPDKSIMLMCKTHTRGKSPFREQCVNPADSMTVDSHLP